MSKERVIIMDDFRPPVASIGGRSPVRMPIRAKRSRSPKN